MGTSQDSEAAARFAEFLWQGGPKKVAPQSGGWTVNDTLDEYLKKTPGEREQVAAAFLRQGLGTLLLSEVDEDACERYAACRRSGEIAAMTTAKVSPRPVIPSGGTIRRELQVLSAACQNAVRRKRIPRNEAPEIVLPEKAPARAAWLFPDELAKLREAATGRTRDFIDLAYFTAGRKASVERLTVAQVDLQGRRIDLRVPGERQTKKRKGIVPIDEDLVPALERIMAAAEAARADGSVPEGYLLGHPGSVRKAFERLAKRTGLLYLPARELRPVCKLTPHALRHSRATHLLQEGVDPYAVADLLHDSIDMVLRVYAHACPSHVKRALDARRKR